MVATLRMAIGAGINPKSNIQNPDPNKLDWKSPRLALGFCGKNSENWLTFLDSMFLSPDLFNVKRLSPNSDDGDLMFAPDNAVVLLSADRQSNYGSIATKVHETT